MHSIVQEVKDKHIISQNSGAIVEDAKLNSQLQTQDGASKKDEPSPKGFFIKEISDRFGYGFGSDGFMNLLFAQLGASNI